MTDLPRLSFAIPPSLGSNRTGEIAKRLQALLRAGGINDVGVYATDSYGSLSLELMTERADLAWAPPSVGARAEVMGGRTLAQTERNGATAYRSAFVGRKGEMVDLGGELSTLNAVWVDPDSVGGYLLPRAWFWARGIDIRDAFGKSRFVGSYSAALEDLLSKRADVTAVYASVSGAAKASSALEDIPGFRDALEIISYTEPAPGDAVVCRASLPPIVRDAVQQRLLQLCETPERQKEFHALFGADRLVKARSDAYAALHDIISLDDKNRGTLAP